MTDCNTVDTTEYSSKCVSDFTVVLASKPDEFDPSVLLKGVRHALAVTIDRRSTESTSGRVSPCSATVRQLYDALETIYGEERERVESPDPNRNVTEFLTNGGGRSTAVDRAANPHPAFPDLKPLDQQPPELRPTVRDLNELLGACDD